MILFIIRLSSFSIVPSFSPTEIKVFNSSNQQIGKWDKDGIDVTGGSIRGSTIYCDGYGLYCVDIWPRNSNGITLNQKVIIQGEFYNYSDKELKDDIKNHLQKILQQDTKKKEILNIVISYH